MTVQSTTALREDYVRTTMRHFAQLRAASPEGAGSAVPFPDDWFDLSSSVLADFGALVYLASLTRFQRDKRLDYVAGNLEPPLRLRQYKILGSNGYPRAALTWAGLSPEAEYRLAVERMPLRPEDWNSGPSVWLMDFFAPFGHVDEIVPLLSHNPALTRLRTLWHNRDGSNARIIEWFRPSPEAPVGLRSYGLGQFRRLMEGEG